MHPAVIEEGCYVRFLTYGSWDTEMHESSGTSCERDVDSYLAVVEHYADFSA